MAQPLPEDDIRILDFHRTESDIKACPDQITLTVVLDSERLIKMVEHADCHNERVHFAGQQWLVSIDPVAHMQTTKSTPDWVQEEWPELVPFHETKQVELEHIYIAELTAVQ